MRIPKATLFPNYSTATKSSGSMSDLSVKVVGIFANRYAWSIRYENHRNLLCYWRLRCLRVRF